MQEEIKDTVEKKDDAPELSFETIKQKTIDRAKEWIRTRDQKKADTLLKEADRMRFVYERTSYINYGNCTKFNKPVSFIPVTCQLETQQCFYHRKDGKARDAEEKEIGVK